MIRIFLILSVCINVCLFVLYELQEHLSASSWKDVKDGTAAVCAVLAVVLGLFYYFAKIKFDVAQANEKRVREAWDSLITCFDDLCQSTNRFFTGHIASGSELKSIQYSFVSTYSHIQYLLELLEERKLIRDTEYAPIIELGSIIENSYGAIDYGTFNRTDHEHIRRQLPDNYKSLKKIFLAKTIFN